MAIVDERSGLDWGSLVLLKRGQYSKATCCKVAVIAHSANSNAGRCLMCLLGVRTPKANFLAGVSY